MYGRNQVLKKLTAAGAVAAAATGIMLAAAPANAGVNTYHSGGILSGNNVIVPITVPVNVCGNAVSVIGISGAGCRGGASVSGPSYHRHYHYRYRHHHCRHHRYPWSS